MSESQFYAILTNKGAALEAAALATGVPVTLDKFVIGDGGGNAVTPDSTRTTLVNEVYRGTIKSAEAKDNQVTFTLYVPPEVGGYTIREAGILVADGTLYSLSNSPDILKPTESNGAVISITFKYILAVSSTSTVTVVVYDDYLTPGAADEKYLQISKNLSEIKDKDVESQKSARENIGIDGDIAFLDKENTFKEINKFENSIVISEDRPISWSTASARIIAYRNDNINFINESGGFLFNHSSSEDLNPVRIKIGQAVHNVYHSGNLKPVLSVNNTKPDSKGNVTVSTGSTGFVSSVRLGAPVSIIWDEMGGAPRQDVY